MKKISKFYQKATLFFGTDEESIELVHLIEASNIPFELIGTGNIEAPCLYYGFQRYEGLEKIKKIIEKWKK